MTGAAADIGVANRGVKVLPEAADTVCCAEVIAAQSDPVASTPFGGDAVLRGSRAVHRELKVLLPAGVAKENGLQVKTILAARAISAAYPEILNIGGVRQDALKWHPHGLALDVMVPNYRSPEGIALGDSIVAYAMANAQRFGLEHVIWRQTFYPVNGSPHMMADLGGDDANHYSHVHIATKGGGYPTGNEVYLR